MRRDCCKFCIGGAMQVSLFQQGQPACAAKRAPLTLKSPLEPGMCVSAYFRTADDSPALHQKVQAALRSCLKDPSAVGSEYASHCSTAIYLHVRASPQPAAVHVCDLMGEQSSRFKGFNPKA